MDEERLNTAIRKFLREIGVTSQREIERVIREGKVNGETLRLRMTLTSEDAPLEHVVETTIELDR
jgi:16S rRNA U516 pseudouridylate synthase RsuA-like enzyme